MKPVISTPVSVGPTMNTLKKILAGLLLLILSFPALAEDTESTSSGEWEKYFEVYGWLPNIYITSSSGSHTTLTISDLIRNLDMLGFIDMGAKKNKWSVATDSIYMNLGKKITREGAVLPGDINV